MEWVSFHNVLHRWSFESCLVQESFPGAQSGKTSGVRFALRRTVKKNQGVTSRTTR